MKRSCLFIALVVFLLIINPVYAAPGINTLGGLGINDYGDCSYGNRAGKSLIQKIINNIQLGYYVDVIDYKSTNYLHPVFIIQNKDFISGDIEYEAIIPILF
ncbi:MAG: hypothetical protein IKN92_04480 [Clostridia bacterium]|nr:hypothetical protein [Clostridia bacterium]